MAGTKTYHIWIRSITPCTTCNIARFGIRVATMVMLANAFVGIIIRFTSVLVRRLCIPILAGVNRCTVSTSLRNGATVVCLIHFITATSIGVGELALNRW